jgi:hypothetical protein
MQSTRPMAVIPEPAPNTRSVIVPTFKGPVIQSEGPLSYACGQCSATLLSNVDYKQVRDIVVKCFACGAFNEIPASQHTN